MPEGLEHVLDRVPEAGQRVVRVLAAVVAVLAGQRGAAVGADAEVAVGGRRLACVRRGGGFDGIERLGHRAGVWAAAMRR